MSCASSAAGETAARRVVATHPPNACRNNRVNFDEPNATPEGAKGARMGIGTLATPTISPGTAAATPALLVPPRDAAEPEPVVPAPPPPPLHSAELEPPEPLFELRAEGDADCKASGAEAEGALPKLPC